MPISTTLHALGSAPPPPPPPPTGIVFYLWDTGTGSGILQTTQPASTKSESITVGAGVESYILTDARQAMYATTPGVAGNYGGNYQATIKVTATFATAWMRIAIEQNGAFLAGGWGQWQAIGSTGTYTLTVNDDPNTVWSSTNSLQLFIDVRNTGTASGTVTWEIGGPTETLATPLPMSPPPPPPPPTGNLVFDGRATLLTALAGHEVLSSQPYTNGPITWANTPFGTHYFYLHHTPVPYQVGTPAYHTRNCPIHGSEPVIWDGINFIKDDISLFADARYGQVYKVAVTTGDTNAWQGNKGGIVNGAGQITLIRATDLGSTKWYGMAVKVDAWSGSVSNIGNCELVSFGYQTSSGSQFALNYANNGGVLSYRVDVNAGYASGVQGGANGTTHLNDIFLPVTFGQWEEFAIGIKAATDTTGFIQIHHRLAGGVWSQVYNKTNIDTELWGPIYTTGGVLIKNFAQDASNWATVTDKMGLYFALTNTVSTETVYETGFITCTDLATAKATFPA